MPNYPHNRKFVVNILLVYVEQNFPVSRRGDICIFGFTKCMVTQYLGANYVGDKFGIGGNIRIWDQLFLILFKFVKGLFVSV